MKYTVYRREFQMRFNGFSYFMGDVVSVVHRTNHRIVARLVAFLTRSKWVEGHLEAGMPPAKKVRRSLRLMWASWKLKRAIKSISKP